MFDHRISKDWATNTKPNISLEIPRGDHLGFLAGLRAVSSSQMRDETNGLITAHLEKIGLISLGRALQNEGIVTDFRENRGENRFASLVETVMNAVEHGTKNLTMGSVRIDVHKLTRGGALILIEHPGEGIPFERIGKQTYGTVDLQHTFPELKLPELHAASRGHGLEYLFNSYLSSCSQPGIAYVDGKRLAMHGAYVRIGFERYDANRGFRTILEYSSGRV